MRRNSYVVVRAMSTTGPFDVARCGWIDKQRGERECTCGDQAITAAHTTNRRLAERIAHACNRAEREGQDWQDARDLILG